MQYALVDLTTGEVEGMFVSQPGNPAHQSGIERAADNGLDLVEPTSIESAPPGTRLRYDAETGVITAWPDPTVAIRPKLEALSKKAQYEALKVSSIELTAEEALELDNMILETDNKAKDKIKD